MQKGFVIGDRGLGASGDTHPDWMVSHAIAGTYLVVGASAIGQIHQMGGSRDDAFNIRMNGPWLAVAVADGVGSRPLSRYGATYTVEALTSQLQRQIVPPVKSETAKLSQAQLNLESSAPPPVSENIEIHPTIYKTTKTQEILQTVSSSLKLEQWTKSILDAESIFEEIPSDQFHQAASIGWWLEEKTSLEESLESIKQQSEPINGSVHSENNGNEENGGQVVEHNLVNIIHEAFIKTHLGLRDHANQLDLDLSQLSCTALAILLNVNTGFGIVGQVGDGAILALSASGKVNEIVNAPETGETQSVYTLNQKNFQDYLGVQLIENPPSDPLFALYLMTDGLSDDLLYSSENEVLEKWAQKVDYNLRHSSTPAQAATGMLNWLATYQVKGSWDDRTLVVITQSERNDGDSQHKSRQQEPS